MMKRIVLLMFLIWGCMLHVAMATPEAPEMSYGTTGLNIAVAWTEVNDATGYALYYAPSPYTGPTSIESLDMGSNTSFSADLWDGAAYYLAIKAYNAEGNSEYSNIGHFVVDSGTETDNPVPPQPSLLFDSVRRLAEAAPDECYVTAELVPDSAPPVYTHPGGVPPQIPVFDGENYTCAEGALPKTNEAYLWGLAEASNRLWFGSVANVPCLIVGSMFDFFPPAERTYGTGSVAQVCEYGASWIFEAGISKPKGLGDWRAPSINFYDLATGEAHYHLEKGELAADPIGKERLEETLGLRSAGAMGDIVFLAGPDLSLNVNIFAFRSSTGEYLGSHVLENYTNIRKWIEIDGQLYTAVAATGDAVSNAMYGHVLKWVGTQDAPFTGPGGSAPFVVVGILPGQGAELTAYGADRIAVSTWPGGYDEIAAGGDLIIGNLQHAGIYISTPLSGAGLDSAAAESNFTEVFTFADYDPDMARSFAYGGGALSYFDGWLIWGSMHPPRTGSMAIAMAYSPFGLKTDFQECRDLIGASSDVCPWRDEDDPGLNNSCIAEKYDTAAPELQEEFDACLVEVNTTEEAGQQAISIFRGRNLEAATAEEREIDVLYGYENMKTYKFDSFFGLPQVGKGSWQDLPNGIGKPVFGEAGFGNPKNFYTWEMRIVNDRLYLGTMDDQTTDDATDPEAGADLYSFSSARRAAVKEDGGGFGNPFNYGIRTMLPGAGNKLYLGTANFFNLAPDDAGGWELIEVEVQ